MLPGPGIFRELALSRRTRAHGTRGLVDAIPSTGGLRVITAGQVILVDVDRTGGIARLAQCWEFVSRHREEGSPRLSLFYVFLSRRGCAGDACQASWDFLLAKARDDCGERLNAHFATCGRPAPFDFRGGNPALVFKNCKAQLEGQSILGEFARALAGDQEREHLGVPLPTPKVLPGKVTGGLE